MKEQLTAEQQQRIQEVESWYNKELNQINERRQYRMQNYYNCVDDYSYGGLCDKADDQSERRIETTLKLRIEEIKKGKIVREISHWELQDLAGNTVSVRPILGRFGHYFPVNGGYVNIPKRMSTVERKGYKIVKRTVTFELLFGGFLSNGCVKWKSINRTGETVTESCDYDYGEQMRYEAVKYQEEFVRK